MNKMTRVYADGVFDLFHHGHARLLEQAKKCRPDAFLLVGVHDDATVHAMKGPTVMTYEERLESVKHCKWVDGVVERAPWKIDEAFISKWDIDVVAHDGDPYPCPAGGDLYEVPKRLGIFVPTQRTPCVSTTDIIQRILDNRDAFAARNASRI